MSWLDIAKKNAHSVIHAEKIQHVIAKHRKNTEIEKLNLSKVKHQLNFDRITNKINVLSDTNFTSKQNISITSFTDEDFDTFSQLITNYDDEIHSFLKNLIQTEQFFIGGSFGTIFAHLLTGENINLDLYKDADIDIYCISVLSEQKLDCILKKIASSLILSKKCLIYKTGILANIIFENPEYRKIQIIFQVKQNIDEHLAFIDLPVTEFTIGYENNEFIMYYTQLSLFALHKKINILFEPISQITDNRTIKYNNRGFINVVAKNGKIIKISDNVNIDTYTTTIITWYCVNWELDNMINYIDEYNECVFRDTEIKQPDSEEIKYRSDSKLIWFLINKNVIDFSEYEKIHKTYELVKTQKNAQKSGYLHTWYETTRICKNIIKKIKKIKSNMKIKYRYLDDESNHVFSNLSNFFSETVILPEDFLKFTSTNLFFSHTVERFLKKQGVYIFDDMYCTKEQYCDFITGVQYEDCDYDYDYDEQLHDTQQKYFKKILKKNSKRNSK
jgi:hypothetical protein